MGEREPEETYSNDGPICPYCGHKHEPDGGFFYDESLTEFDCDRCGREVAVSVFNSWSWTCEPTENLT